MELQESCDVICCVGGYLGYLSGNYYVGEEGCTKVYHG